MAPSGRAGAIACPRSGKVEAHRIQATRPRHSGRYEAGQGTSLPTLAPWQVSLAMRTMRCNLGGSISISEVASLCRLSLCYFVRAFTNTVGIAPYAWFVEQRIMWAKSLLADTALPLAQVALECGFSDQAHFTKAFVKASGITPAKWRRQICACSGAAAFESEPLSCCLIPQLSEQPHGDWQARAGQGHIRADSSARNHAEPRRLQGA